MGVAEYIYTVLLKPAPLRRITNTVLLKMVPRTLRVGPAVVHVNPNDPVISGALTLRVYERGEITFVSRTCKPGMVFVDIGANVGLYSAIALHLTGPDGRIISLEPHPESRNFLSRTLAANDDSGKRYQIVPAAASDCDSTTSLFMNPQNKGDNRLYETELTAHSTLIRTRRLDDILAEFGAPTINYLKIDVQGLEHRVIAGARETIARSPRLILLSEIFPDGIRASGGDPMAYVELLASMGFDLYELSPRGIPSPLPTRQSIEALLARYTGRQYTSLVGVKGYTLDELL